MPVPQSAAVAGRDLVGVDQPVLGEYSFELRTIVVFEAVAHVQIEQLGGVVGAPVHAHYGISNDIEMSGIGNRSLQRGSNRVLCRSGLAAWVRCHFWKTWNPLSLGIVRRCGRPTRFGVFY